MSKPTSWKHSLPPIRRLPPTPGGVQFSRTRWKRPSTTSWSPRCLSPKDQQSRRRGHSLESELPKPGEHKTVQARILEYAQEIGWTYVGREEAEARRGFDPEGA